MIAIRSIQIGRVRQFNDTEDTPKTRASKSSSSKARASKAPSSKSSSSKAWSSGIIKSAIDGPIRVTTTSLVGDEQADPVHHGGVDKAVLVYPSEHYPFWGTEFNEIEWVNGCFGENLTTGGAIESDACIGDIFRAGDCQLQISQPRQPCWKLSQRWGLPKLAVRVQQTGRTGWYLRVLAEGTLKPDDEMQLVDRPFPQFTITHANEVMYGKTGKDPDRESRNERVERSHHLAACDALSDSWKKTLLSR